MTFLQQSGIMHQFSCPYNSAQNARVERKHIHVVETGLALLTHAYLPMKFWQYAFQSSTFFINRMPSKVLNNDSPYYTLFHKIPEYKSLRVIGFLCYPFIHPCNNHMLQYRSIQCIFLGYSFNNKGYLCLDSLTGRVYVTTHVVFYETQFLFTKPTSPSLTNDTPTEIFTSAILPLSSSLPSTNNNHSPPPSSFTFTSDSSYFMSSSTTTPVSHSVPESIPADQAPCSAPAPCMTIRLMHGITKKKTILDLFATKLSEPYTLNQALKFPN
jgi:histone deacetylase 1/2